MIGRKKRPGQEMLEIQAISEIWMYNGETQNIGLKIAQ
jgi:hypothetical protein